MTFDPLIEEFLDYTQSRGVPDRFRPLYRKELAAILQQAGATSIDHLQGDALIACVKEAERRLQTVHAVCVALEQFLSHRRKEIAAEGPSSSNSPAYLAPNTAEHRRYVRVPFHAHVHIAGSAAENRCSDLSVGGMYLETPQPLRLGSTVQIAFKLRSTDPEPLRLRAKVVYSDPGAGAGLDFIDPPRDMSRAIRRFIEQLVTKKQPKR